MSHEFLSLNNPYIREFLSSAANSNANTAAAKKALVKASKANASYKYPAFLEAANAVNYDPFWRKLLQDAAKGKFMSNFFFDGVSLSYRHKGHTELASDCEAEDRATTFIQFHQKFGVQSPRDVCNGASNKTVFQPISDASILKSISKSVPKRSEMIRKYVNIEYSHLPKYIQSELITQIYAAFDTKRLKTSDIVIQDGNIVNIDGLEASEEGVSINKEIPVSKKGRSSNSSRASSKPSNEHYEAWLKYLKAFSEDLDHDVVSKDTLIRIKSALNSSGKSTDDSTIISESMVCEGSNGGDE